MSIRVSALALCGLLACSGPAAAPAPTPTPAPTPAPGAAPAPAAAARADADGKAGPMPASDGPAPAKEPPLTQEEIDLIDADPATLTPELRRKRAFALRRKILQNPDSPIARQLESMRLAAERGELDSQLPPKPGDKRREGGVTLQARTPAGATPEPAKTDSPPAAPAPAP